jgi:hypothetical protein
LLTFKKVNKINALRRFSTDFSHRFSTPICHCGKIVEIIPVFPQFHNLFITWRRECDKKIVFFEVFRFFEKKLAKNFFNKLSRNSREACAKSTDFAQMHHFPHKVRKASNLLHSK